MKRHKLVPVRMAAEESQQSKRTGCNESAKVKE